MRNAPSVLDSQGAQLPPYLNLAKFPEGDTTPPIVIRKTRRMDQPLKAEGDLSDWTCRLLASSRVSTSPPLRQAERPERHSNTRPERTATPSLSSPGEKEKYMRAYTQPTKPALEASRTRALSRNPMKRTCGSAVMNL